MIKCVRCSLPAKRGKTRCAVHLAELAEQAKARREERAKLGRCPQCGQTLKAKPVTAADDSTWQSMMSRCYDSENESYRLFGGRGIAVCKRWHKARNFFADMGPRPSVKHYLDRVDNDGDYKPGNCRWVTVGRQRGNRY